MTNKIEWTDQTWNPVTGCTKISAGCKNCYAERMALRLNGRHGYPAKPHHFDVTLRPDRLGDPLKWRKPRRVFVCSMSDLFHEDVPFEFITEIFEVMRKASGHTFQILTKRPERMKEFVAHYLYTRMLQTGPPRPVSTLNKNIWLGVTAENQEQADKRVASLLQIPAAVHFVSVEPMLDWIDIHPFTTHRFKDRPDLSYKGIDWVICGGETGHGARPIHPDWVRDLRDECVFAHTPFLFKKWGGPHGQGWVIDGKLYQGREIDGREWNEFPKEPQP